jgi:hypothetical protein
MDIKGMKAEQHANEVELLEELVECKLAAVWADVAITRRGLRNVTDDEGEEIALNGFVTFVAALGVEFGNSKEEFLRAMGDAFDFTTDFATSVETAAVDDGVEEKENEPPVKTGKVAGGAVKLVEREGAGTGGQAVFGREPASSTRLHGEGD